MVNPARQKHFSGSFYGCFTLIFTHAWLMAKKKKKNGGFEVANQITSQETEKAWGNNYTKQQNHVLFMAYTKFYTQKPLFFVSPHI